jgi:hypothetical protein
MKQEDFDVIPYSFCIQLTTALNWKQIIMIREYIFFFCGAKLIMKAHGCEHTDW